MFRPIALALGLALAFPASVAARPKTEATAPLPALASVPNLRDMGGIVTKDGKHKLRSGILFRSDQLDKMTDADLVQFAKLNLATIIDLRTDGERKQGADRMPAGARAVVLNVLGDKGDQAEMMKAAMAKGSEQMMLGLYRDFASTPRANDAFRGVMTEVVSAKAPTLFHCTAGKDRTGWSAAIILTLLGVSRETIVADFLASNERLVAKNEAFYASRPTVPRAMLEPVFTVRRSYIEESFAEVDRRYGSFDAYAVKILGMDKKAVRRLKKRYLERA